MSKLKPSFFDIDVEPNGKVYIAPETEKGNLRLISIRENINGSKTYRLAAKAGDVFRFDSRERHTLGPAFKMHQEHTVSHYVGIGVNREVIEIPEELALKDNPKFTLVNPVNTTTSNWYNHILSTLLGAVHKRNVPANDQIIIRQLDKHADANITHYAAWVGGFCLIGLGNKDVPPNLDSLSLSTSDMTEVDTRLSIPKLIEKVEMDQILVVQDLHTRVIYLYFRGENEPARCFKSFLNTLYLGPKSDLNIRYERRSAVITVIPQ